MQLFKLSKTIQNIQDWKRLHIIDVLPFFETKSICEDGKRLLRPFGGVDLGVRLWLLERHGRAFGWMG